VYGEGGGSDPLLLYQQQVRRARKRRDRPTDWHEELLCVVRMHGTLVRVLGVKMRRKNALHTVHATGHKLHGSVSEFWNRGGLLQVRPLVEATVRDGHNATVFAYGQTGAGKTHTMGTAAGVCLSLSPSSGAQSPGDAPPPSLWQGAVIPQACNELRPSVRPSVRSSLPARPSLRRQPLHAC
jgi:Kinesin motor domain